ncbi:radical SAM/SPASM domain-containing protein [Paenibacillus fonticola]|uniref:radical SAM/SPASM domain-containing protein n=1 Tax=Paenibacillus fonticola TaxID=379896 RepID=UPI00036F09A6|nr:radical SAM protein [Paenibacillus fonticola]
MIVNRYMLRFPVGDEVLLINTLTGAVDFFSYELVQIMDQLNGNEDAEAELSEECIELLLQRGYLFRDEFDQERRINQATTIVDSSEMMHYIVCPTYACNYRCSYCFEGHSQHENMEVMSDQQLNKVMEFIDQVSIRNGNKPGLVNLFGGEPLLPMTKNVVGKICKMASERKLQIGCNTNGYFLESFIEIFELYKERMSVLVTVDGPKEIHDIRRYLVGGQGTFDVIHRGVRTVLETGIQVILRVNIDRKNIDHISSLIQYYDDIGLLDYENLSISLSAVTNHTCQEIDSTILQGYEILRKLLSATPKIKELLNKNRLKFGSEIYRLYRSTMLLDPRLGGHIGMISPNYTFCEAAEGRMYAFGPDNYIYPCPDLVGRPEYSIGQFFPELQINESLHNKWCNFNSYTIPQCIECPSAPICGGWCPTEALLVNGSLDKPNCPRVHDRLEKYIAILQDESPLFERRIQ